MLEEVFDCLSAALLLSDVIGCDPRYGHRLLGLVLHLRLVLIEQELGGLLQEDVIVTFPCAVDVHGAHHGGKLAVV